MSLSGKTCLSNGALLLWWHNNDQCKQHSDCLVSSSVRIKRKWHHITLAADLRCCVFTSCHSKPPLVSWRHISSCLKLSLSCFSEWLVQRSETSNMTGWMCICSPLPSPRPLALCWTYMNKKTAGGLRVAHMVCVHKTYCCAFVVAWVK